MSDVTSSGWEKSENQAEYKGQRSQYNTVIWGLLDLAGKREKAMI